MRRFLFKIFKIVLVVSVVILFAFILLIHKFFQLKTDEEIQEIFIGDKSEIYISKNVFNDYEYRMYSNNMPLDSTLPNLVFVHGSPGSAMDFKHYFLDKDLSSKANLIAFDRIGYNPLNLGAIQPISFETELLNALTSKLTYSKTILVGYSYGGPIALASKKEYKKIILCAPALFSEIEPMFWFLNFYKWKATRWVMPEMLKAASKEKLSHQKYLKEYESNWGENPSSIYVIHGDKDWIVPYKNSELLQQQFPKEKIKLFTLKEASHDLIWSRFEEVKKVLLKAIDE